MAAVSLPTTPTLRSGGPFLIDAGGVLKPILGGGVDQRLNRAGSRYGIEVELPPVPDEPGGRIWASLLRQGVSQGVLYPFPQPGLVVGSPGSPAVNGAVAGGTSLPMRGLSGSYKVRQGQFFSVIHAGRRYVYAAAADATASGAGTVSVPIEVMLRTALSDGDTIEMASPIIEGLIDGDPAMKLQYEPYHPVSFRIIERA